MVSNRHNLASRLEDALYIIIKNYLTTWRDGCYLTQQFHFLHWCFLLMIQPWSYLKVRKFVSRIHWVFCMEKCGLIMPCVPTAKWQLISSAVEAKNCSPQQNIMSFLLKQYYCQTITFYYSMFVSHVFGDFSVE